MKALIHRPLPIINMGVSLCMCDVCVRFMYTLSEVSGYNPRVCEVCPMSEIYVCELMCYMRVK